MRLEVVAARADKTAPPLMPPGAWMPYDAECPFKEKLGQTFPFSLLSSELLTELTAKADVLHFTESAPIFQAQEPAESVYVALSGSAVLHGPGDVIVGAVNAPGVLGAADLFAGRRMFAANSAPGLVVLRIPRADMMAALEKSGVLANAFLGVIAAATQNLADALMAQRCLTGVQRLAAFLLEQAGKAGTDDPFVLRIPKKIIAGHLGMTPVHFARSLTRLSEAGVERRARNIVAVNDLSALRRLLAGEICVATQEGGAAQHKQRAAYMSFRGHS